MKLKFLKSIYLLDLLLLSTIIVSCVDDFPYSNVEIPEGDGTLSASVTFTPVAATNLGATRTDGNELNNITSLSVLVYDLKGNLFRRYDKDSDSSYKLDGYSVGKVDVNKEDSDNNVNVDETDETSTARANFKLNNLPYGKYYIYAVANVKNLNDFEEDIQTVDGLKNIRLTWNEKTISDNAQMFGYFTPANNMESAGFGADPITFTNKQTTQIHAWLKRAASKVTVAFDPSGLNQGVRIYIRSVTIRDIPKTCLLGADNTPTSVEGLDGLLNHIDTPFGKPDYQNPSSAIDNSRLEYNSKGVITDSEEHTGDKFSDGLRLDNSIRNAVPANAHDVDAPSLFFYENNQNSYLENIDPNYKSKTLYDKRQQPSHDTNGDGVGKPVRDETIDNKQSDLKDKVPYGSYIEVDAYYVSDNPAKIGAGSIKYRFMLGKDVSFNYDAQRNYHFKLTLGFKGWANDPDWHIDYELPNPGIEVPPTFRVSYLYQQMSELPIRIIGECRWLTVQITENNWAPYSPTPNADGYYVPDAEITNTTPTVYQFKWNYEAYTNPEYLETATIPVGDHEETVKRQKPAYGFLALHLPNRKTTAIETGYGPDANDALEKYYEDNLEGERRFDITDLSEAATKPDSYGDRNKQGFTASVDDAYKVENVLNDEGQPLANQKTLLLPVWTRTKTLISESGFSGNNPYEAFERKAVLHIRAVFTDGTTVNKDVEVLQVKRIVNPKGVWRAHDRTEAFNVTLLEADNSNAESNFHAFTSDGEWTAYIEGNDNGFSLRPNGKTNGYMENGVIHGYTGSTIDFAINFGTPVNEDESKCAIVKVLYHGNQCLHKILIRKGYNAPIRIGSKPHINSKGETVYGRLWSSFSLYQATWRSGNDDGVNDTYEAVLTKNPLMLGSMFRRGKQSRGIFVKNNQREDLGPFMPPGNIPFIVGRRSTGTDEWMDQTWVQIGYRDDCFEGSNNATEGRTRGSREYNMGSFYTIDEDGNRTNYKVPSFDDFEDLTESCEYGFGVFYGSAATGPALTADDAYGLIDPENDGLFNLEYGMRGVVAYDKNTGNQIFFPMGRFGTGRRNNFVLTGDNAGVLRYGDVANPLAIGPTNKNLYRPIPYNLPIQCGNVYWIDQYQYNVRTQYGTNEYGARGSLGWDMNYFNFDFNAYTANNYRDACPIKFVIVE